MITILTTPRTGSSYYAACLDEQPLIEPYNINCHDQRYPQIRIDKPSPTKIKSMGIKVVKFLICEVVGCINEVYEVSDEIHILKRRDLFSQVLSNAISYTLQCWHGDVDFVRKSGLDYVKPNDFIWSLNFIQDQNDFLERNPPPSEKTRTLFYEDHYTKPYYNGPDTFERLINLGELVETFNTWRHRDS